MAWVDDRIWCHPKFVGLTLAARWAWVCGVTYSSGFNTRGVLLPGVLVTLGVSGKVRGELVRADLWLECEDGGVMVAGWDEHNGARDDRKLRDRERKRLARQQARLSAGLSADMSAETSADVHTLKSERVKSEEERHLKAVLNGREETGAGTGAGAGGASSREMFGLPDVLKDMPA